MLEELNQRVQSLLNQSSNRVILGVYQEMINSHNDMCGCNYCFKLREYVDNKIQLRKEIRILDKCVDNDNQVIRCYINIKYLNNKISCLKKEKDSLKLM